MSEFDGLTDLVETLEANVAEEGHDLDQMTEMYHNAMEALANIEDDNWEEKDLSDIKSRLETLKVELDIYDEEGELDMMFPDRHDEDFDVDSMNSKD